MPSILILEDNSDIREIYELMLAGEYELSAVDSIKELKHFIETSKAAPDLLIADMSLPDGFFLHFLQNEQWAKRVRDWPILVVSSIDDVSVIDQVVTDHDIDYITKPFNRNELLVKCRRLIQRPRKPELVLCPTTLRLQKGDLSSEPLTAVESKIVNMLIQAGKEGAQRVALTRAIWGEEKQSKKLDVHMTRIRKKIRSIGINVIFHEPDIFVLETANSSVPLELEHEHDT